MSYTNFDANDLELLVLVDDICEEFQSQFESGKNPRIEDFLTRVETKHSSSLLRELLALEATLRSEHGEEVSAESMLQRYSNLFSADTDRELLVSEIERAIEATDKRLGATTTIPSGPGGEIARKTERPRPTIEGFEIEEVLGKGGMGIVYKARQIALKRTVALKMILRDPSEIERHHLERFKNEAHAIAELNDPHFVQIFEFGEAKGNPYMALEFVEGGSLEQHRQGEPQEIEFSAKILHTMSVAMQKAHAAGLVHRDLKPHNVLLTGELQPKIADFGLVKRQDQDETAMTKQGTVMGTASYMAPEQSRGASDLGPPADVHALGGILYCLLTGRPPYLASNVVDTINQVRNDEPVPPSRLRPKVPKDLETICLKCLEKQPDKRYATAGDLADDLSRYLAGKPIQARPVSASEHAWRWARRNPIVASLGSSVAGLLIAIAVITSIFSWQNAALAEERRIQKEKAEAAEGVAKEKEEQAKKERDVATNVADLAVQTVNDIASKVHTTLRNSKRERDLAKNVAEILDQKLSDIRTFVGENPLERRTQAMLLQRIGDHYRWTNNLKDSLTDYEQSYSILEKLCNEDPTDEIHHFNLGIASHKLAELHYRLGNTQKARDYFTEGLARRKRRAELISEEATEDTQSQCQWNIADSHEWIGKMHIALGDPAAALENFQDALSVWEKLPRALQRGVSNGGFRKHTFVQQMLGESFYLLGYQEEAKRWLDLALERRVELFTKRPFTYHRHDLSITHISYGDFHIFGGGKLSDAWEHYKKAEEQFLLLWQEDPASARARHDLAIVYYRLGATLLRAEEAGETLEGAGDKDSKWYFSECERLRRELAEIDDNDLQSKIEWALALARSGQATEASAQADILLEKGEGNPRLLSQAAYTYALCSVVDGADRENLRAKSIEVLRACAEAGWKDWVALRDDPDLDPVRDHPEFDAILNQVKEAALGPA